MDNRTVGMMLTAISTIALIKGDIVFFILLVILAMGNFYVANR